MTYDNLVHWYGIREILANDTMEGIDKLFLFNLYFEFAFVGFIVLIALFLRNQ